MVGVSGCFWLLARVAGRAAVFDECGPSCSFIGFIGGGATGTRACAGSYLRLFVKDNNAIASSPRAAELFLVALLVWPCVDLSALFFAGEGRSGVF